MTGDIAILADSEVLIGGKKYSMTASPSADSEIVEEAIRNTLASIKLEQMCDDLSLTGDMIYCAYNGIDPKYGELRALVAGLHKSFVDLLLRSEHQMTELEAISGEILPDLSKVFRFLMSNKEDIAVTFLKNAAEKATRLSSGMKQLADEYAALGVKAQTAVELAEKQQGMELQQIEALKTKLADIRAENERATDLSQRLATAVKDLQSKYEEAKSKAESSENRAFALSIIGSILRPLADGVGAAAGAFARVQVPGLNLPSPTPAPAPAAAPAAEKPAADKPAAAKPAAANEPAKSKEALTVDKEKADAAVADAQKKLEAETQAVTAKTSEVESAKAKLTGAEADAKKDGLSAQEKKDKEAAATAAKLAADEAKAQLEILEKKKKEAADALTAAKAKAKEIGDAIEKIGKAIGEAGSGIGKMGENFFELADSYRQEKVNFLNLLMKKQEEEDKTLADMKKYALQMKNIDMQTQTLAVTVEALFQAIKALKRVVTNLQVAAQFWRNMADGCARLANPALADDIAAYKSLSLSDKLELYAETEFKQNAVRYLAGWVGMQTIAKRYTSRMTDIRSRASEDYGNYLGPEAARKKAAELGTALAISALKGESESEKAKSVIAAALKEATAEAQAAA
ncbi:hypothetical protein [Paracoccus aminovorans]|uniref:hypothetical protein n=1 Tax=Paracoccus aminovorans TaxID=34004 RepID=UPI002B2591B8|nr:hypothetical protein [Paracoccus aminovorans]